MRCTRLRRARIKAPESTGGCLNRDAVAQRDLSDNPDFRRRPARRHMKVVLNQSTIASEMIYTGINGLIRKPYAPCFHGPRGAGRVAPPRCPKPPGRHPGRPPPGPSLEGRILSAVAVRHLRRQLVGREQARRARIERAFSVACPQSRRTPNLSRRPDRSAAPDHAKDPPPSLTPPTLTADRANGADALSSCTGWRIRIGRLPAQGKAQGDGTRPTGEMGGDARAGRFSPRPPAPRPPRGES